MSFTLHHKLWDLFKFFRKKNTQKMQKSPKRPPKTCGPNMIQLLITDLREIKKKCFLISSVSKCVIYKAPVLVSDQKSKYVLFQIAAKFPWVCILFLAV